MDEAPPDVQDLAAERAARRAARDFAAADALRDRIARAGWTVVDDAEGWRLEPVAVDVVPAGPVTARDVVSVLDEPATADASLHWVVEGWPQDVRRAIDSFRANAGGRDLHYVVADVTGEPPEVWGDDVEVVQLDHGTGWGAARNAGLKRSRGGVVLALDGSIEATGDVLGPLEAALADRHRRRLRTVRHRDARPPRVRQHGRPGGGRDRGLLHGVPSRHPLDAQACSTRSSVGTGRPTSNSRSGSRIWGCGPWSCRCPSSVTSTGCGSRRPPRTAPGGPSGTSTGSSIDGATGTT